MTLALDTSALLALAVDGPQRAVVLDSMRTDPIWCASALALTEALPAIDRLTDEAVLRADLEDAIRLAWDHIGKSWRLSQRQLLIQLAHA